MPDVRADSSLEVYSRAGVFRAVLNVSDPATSSYLRFFNDSKERLRLTVIMVQGVPSEGNAPTPPSAIGTHDIDPGQQYTVAFHDSLGGGTAANAWVTNFTIGSTVPRSTIRLVRISVNLVNGPGAMPGGRRPGANWTTIQVT
jgi:hypothetical protein